MNNKRTWGNSLISLPVFKMLMCLSMVTILCCMFSCTEDEQSVLPMESQRTIKVSAIPDENYTRATGEMQMEGYRCSSPASSLVSNIYVDTIRNVAVVDMLNNKGEVAYSLEVRLEGKMNQPNVYEYTAYNEVGDPVMGGTYDFQKSTFDINKVYGNDVVTRASAASWGCNLGLQAAGLAWSIPLGMISFGASAAVSIAYTIAAIEICDGL